MKRSPAMMIYNSQETLRTTTQTRHTKKEKLEQKDEVEKDSTEENQKKTQDTPREEIKSRLEQHHSTTTNIQVPIQNIDELLYEACAELDRVIATFWLEWADEDITTSQTTKAKDKEDGKKVKRWFGFFRLFSKKPKVIVKEVKMMVDTTTEEEECKKNECQVVCETQQQETTDLEKREEEKTKDPEENNKEATEEPKGPVVRERKKKMFGNFFRNFFKRKNKGSLI